jgi:hypothetical protein
MGVRPNQAVNLYLMVVDPIPAHRIQDLVRERRQGNA